jgi:hypothetical protein
VSAKEGEELVVVSAKFVEKTGVAVHVGVPGFDILGEFVFAGFGKGQSIMVEIGVG